MKTANTSSHAIRDAIDICVRTLYVLRTTNTKLRGKYVAAGSDWSDTKYQQLGDIINECTSSFDKAISDLDDCLVPLNNLEQSIAEYESVHFAGDGISSSVNTIPLTETTGGSVGIIVGGAYKDCKKYSNGKTQHVHHMPPNSISNPRNSGLSLITRSDGPAITMDIEDHKKTASYDSRNSAIAYRERQIRGSFRDALQMDIDDIRSKFGDKCDNAINELLRYVGRIESERGRIW